jgi:hypothetical protein
MTWAIEDRVNADPDATIYPLSKNHYFSATNDLRNLHVSLRKYTVYPAFRLFQYSLQ